MTTLKELIAQREALEKQIAEVRHRDWRSYFVAIFHIHRNDNEQSRCEVP